VGRHRKRWRNGNGRLPIALRLRSMSLSAHGLLDGEQRADLSAIATLQKYKGRAGAFASI
jgi:hypothetical protein